MIDTKLIENSFQLCWKEYSYTDIEHYSYFLLSPEFIEKYEKHTKQDMHYIDTKKDLYRLFWQAIGEYQAKDKNLLVSLLSKI
jgi:hypothetical protein